MVTSPVAGVLSSLCALVLYLVVVLTSAVCSSVRCLGLLCGPWVLPMLTSAFLVFSEEERTRFQKLLASPAYRASPLLAIGQQLAHQMQLEGSEQL